MVSVEEFLWILLKNTELNQPNYHAIARELGSGNANTVQKKFKAYAVQAGYRLVNRQIEGPVSGNRSAAPSPTNGGPSAGGSGNGDGPAGTSPSNPIVPTATLSNAGNASAANTSTSTDAANVLAGSGHQNKKRKVRQVIDISDDESGAADEMKEEDDNDTDSHASTPAPIRGRSLTVQPKSKSTT